MSDYKAMKVAELRALCAEQGLDSKGTKDALIARLSGGGEAKSDEKSSAAKKTTGAAASKKAATKKAKKNDEEEEDEPADEPEEKKPAKKAPVKKAAAKSKKAVKQEEADDEQDDEQEEQEQKPKKKESKKADGKRPRRVQTDRLIPLSGATVVEGHGVMLNQTNIAGNNNKFYVIQLLENGGTYYVWNRWGRVGENGQNKLHGPFSDFKKALAEFSKKFKEKTKNVWSDTVRDTFTPFAGKYTLLDMADDGDDDEDDGNDEAPKKAKKAVPKANKNSKLSEEVQAFVNRIYAEASANLKRVVNCEFTSKGIKTPLGVLSIAQVEKGDAILDEILQEIKGKNRSARLQELSSQYYTNIPHVTGRERPPTINTEGMFHEKMELSQLMKDMLNVADKDEGASVLVEDDVDAKYDALGTTIRHVAPGSAEYEAVVNHIAQHKEEEDHERFGTSGDGFDPKKPAKIDEDAQNNADEMKERIFNIYALDREEEAKRYNKKLGNDHYLFHASRFGNFVGILSRGLLLPEAVTKLGIPRTDFGWLGAGIYFGAEWSTSEGYCQPAQNDSDNRGLMLVLQVALGKVHEQAAVDGSIRAPPKGFDSIHGNPDLPNSGFSDHEYCVYSNSQAAMKYIVEFSVY